MGSFPLNVLSRSYWIGGCSLNNSIRLESGARVVVLFDVLSGLCWYK